MSAEVKILLILMLSALLFCALGTIWDMHLTIAAQDQTIDMLQKVKCVGEYKT